MHIPRHDTLRLQLISILILLIGLSIDVCGASEADEALIEEAAEPLVVTILDRLSDGPAVPARSDAEILADIILARETEDFFFDIPRRNQLVGEIEGVLSLIRAAYPLMNGIHAREGSEPGMLWIRLERDFYEILKEMLQDKQGSFRFETGNAEFDALNAKLGVQNVRWGGDTFKSVFLYFDQRVNLRVAIEAYSMVEGVGEVWRNPSVGDRPDIKAFKQGATWYVIFRNGWGDCPAGCIYEESFCFTVTGTDVATIPTAQAQTMPPFQELDPSLHNDTPLVNATAHTWSWWDSRHSKGHRSPSVDYNLGCSLFGEIEAFPNLLSVSCGYSVEELPRGYSFFDDYDFTGVVLLLSTTQKRTVIGNGEAPSSVVASKVVRVAKTAAEIENPENVHFENVLVPINPPPLSSPFERWWGGVQPIFVVCWDHPETGWRSYQFLTPHIMHASSDEAKNQHGCDNFRDTDYIQTLDVSSPPLVLRTMFMKKLLGVSMLPDSDNWRDWVDEALPRP